MAGFKKFLQRSNRRCPEYIMQNKHKEATLRHKDNHEISTSTTGIWGMKTAPIDIQRLVFFPPKSILRGFASLTVLNVDLLQTKYMAGRFSSRLNMHMAVHCRVHC